MRKNVQSCLQLLASRTGSEVSELLEHLYQPLLQPLIMRPLRSRTVDQQVKFVSTGNFLEYLSTCASHLIGWRLGWDSYGFEFLPGLEATSSQVDSRIS